MASSNGETASPDLENNSVSQAFSVPLSMSNQTTSTDDSGGWEYEYSETETEVRRTQCHLVKAHLLINSALDLLPDS